MTELKIKPLSVNEAWQGRRFKTNAYLNYTTTLLWLLPQSVIVPDGPIRVYYEFGLSNIQADWDNPVKPLQDVLQSKYGFNDKMIMEAHVIKVKVAKGEEYIKLKFEKYET